MASENKSNSLVDIKDILFFWHLIKKNIAILIIIPLMALLAGYVFTYRLPDVYGAKVQLMLKSDQTYDYQDPIYKGLGAYGLYMDVRNQIRVLQSRDLIREVVQKLDVDVSYYVLGRIRKQEVFGTLPFKVEPEVYNPATVLNMPIEVKILDVDTYELTIDRDGEIENMTGKFGEFLNTPNFGVTLTKNYQFTEETIEHLGKSEYEVVLRSEDYMINYFQSRMEIENLEHTSILEVKVTDDIGARGKMFLDTLSYVFMDHSKRTQLEINQNTLDNIEKQIEEVKKMLVSIEKELLKYKGDNDIIHLNKEEEEYFRQFMQYSERNRVLQSKLTSTKLLEDYVKNSDDERLLPPSFYILEGDTYLSTKVAEFYQQQLLLLDRLQYISESHPEIVDMQGELVLMRKDILTYIKNLTVALQAQIDDNNKFKEKFKREVQTIPLSLQGIENINRELDVNNKMYLFLLEKRTNTLIAKAGIIPQVQIIQSASSLGIIGPERGKIQKLFLLGGVVLAFSIALIRKLFFERISTVSELEDVSNIPVIGGIPLQKDLNETIAVLDKPKAHVTECFRTVRSNLEFMGGSGTNKVILISSFFPGEGKTFCSANLSVMIANTDKKVLLVDFDLHKPRVHKALNLKNDIGMSNYLIDKNSFDEIVNKDFHPNMDVITSGPLAPNPSELILKKKLNDFVDYVRENYEVVIFDSPPFGILNDAPSLAKHSDIFLAVMNTRFTMKRGVQRVEKQISKHTDLSTGIILNGIKQSKLSYYYGKMTYKYAYRYSYGTDYGYGYGYRSEYED